MAADYDAVTTAVTAAQLWLDGDAALRSRLARKTGVRQAFPFFAVHFD
jgi:hypothetical protein|eukprot:SAG25_NODE_170_length_13039_cov_23.733153_11_plen_48_part_00